MKLLRLFIVSLLLILLLTGCQPSKVKTTELKDLEKEEAFQTKARGIFSKYQSEKLQIINEDNEEITRQAKDQKLLNLAQSYQSDFERVKGSGKYEDDLKLVEDYFKAEIDFYQSEIELEELKDKRQQTNIMTSEEAKKMIELLDKSEARYNLLDKLQSEAPYLFTEQP